MGWEEPVSTARSHFGGDRFRLLGEEHSISTASDWRRRDLEELWLYNLHYFEDLRATDSAARRAEQRDLMLRWVRENPPGSGVGWDPYPTSLRISNWIKWALAGGELGDDLERSLALQAEQLSRRIEHHLQGNHLIANAKGLAFAGLFFGGEAARRWLATGAALLEEQLPEQVLADGAHCELSPMYHALVLEDLLDLINLSRAAPAGTVLAAPRLLEPRVRPMLEWLRRMLHPDGEIAFFNDAALGIAAHPADLFEYAERLEFRTNADALRDVEHLSASGYVRARCGEALLIADVGEIGPRHLTGHSHADTLSFELSLGGRRVFVNSGTSCYGTGAERLRQRSTAAHNTLELDGESSSEVWSGFRVGRRAHPVALEIGTTNERIAIRCSHNGYRHRPGRPVHERSFELRSGGLEIVDRIYGPFSTARASLHLAPPIRAQVDPEASRASLELPGGRRLGLEVRGGALRLENTTHHPRFGTSEPSDVLRFAQSAPVCVVRVRWT
jgi:uncharacterized heparinase superfamily protein